MLKGNTSYGFLVSSDEVMFLRIEIETSVSEVNIAVPGEEPEYADIDLFTQPRLCYSDPIKHTDILDPEKGTLPVKLALLHVVHLVMVGLGEYWKMPMEEKIKCANVFEKTNARERWKFTDPRKTP
jgi:hypothetical protein